MNRFLSRKEKPGSSHRRDKSRDKSSDKKIRPISGDTIFGLFKPDPQKKEVKDTKDTSDLGQKIIEIKERLKDGRYTAIYDDAINYAINSQHANGDVDKAYEVLILFQQSVEGIIMPYNPAVHMKGAVNRGNVTCYLDSLLFAMFGRLGSFEPILYTNFDDEPRRRLSTLIRLWVNMLRTGLLIHTDVTSHIQEALAACGWKEAASNEQQDTSEAFGFITETLQLPLLTLKMDIYHTGAEDATDDHKFINERLLDVAIPDAIDRSTKLEDCLESYFNNRIEVKRRLERTNTLSSIRSNDGLPSTEKQEAQHIEISELSWSTPNTPTSATAPNTPITPGGRFRATSIIRHLVIEEDEKDDGDASSTRPSLRKGSVRKEVLMPAWQFFNLIPWYTKTSPTNDAEVAIHFAKTRPVLGICLKRYGMTPTGECFRKDTHVDIPLDIRLPHFIEEQDISDDGPFMGNFKLSLQSFICHRGNSVNSGHYISYMRGTSQVPDGDSQSNRRLSSNSHPPHYSAERWIGLNDLSEPRVQYVDIEEVLEKETPYLLFYQVQPTWDDSPPPGLQLEPPSYADSGIEIKQNCSPSLDGQASQGHHGYFDGARDESTPSIRLSTDVERLPPPRQSLNLPDEDRRGSVTFTEESMISTASSLAATSPPATPSEESTAQRMSRAAARFTKSSSKSRPTSSSGENRISATFSRLNLMRSKEQLNKTESGKEIPLPNTDGAVDGQASITIEDNSLKPAESTSDQTKSKRGRKRDKSKGPFEKGEKEHSHRHHSHHKGNGKEKGGKDIPERECITM